MNKCDLCNYTTNNISNFYKHCTTMIHLEREEIKLYCYSCNKLFKSLNLYKTHKRNVHNKKSKGNKSNKKNKIILNSNDSNNLKDTNISTETQIIIRQVKDEINKMEAKEGYYDMDEILDKVNLKKDIVTINNVTQTISTDTTMDEESEITLGDTLKSDDNIEDNYTSEYIFKLMSVLNNEEADVIKRVYGFPPYLMAQPVECIAENYKSTSYVNTLIRRAMKKLTSVAKISTY